MASDDETPELLAHQPRVQGCVHFPSREEGGIVCRELSSRAHDGGPGRVQLLHPAYLGAERHKLQPNELTDLTDMAAEGMVELLVAGMRHVLLETHSLAVLELDGGAGGGARGGGAGRC